MSLDRQIDAVAASASEPRLDTRDKTFFATLLGSQAFWVTIALVIISGVMSIREPVFANRAPARLVRLGMTRSPRRSA